MVRLVSEQHWLEHNMALDRQPVETAKNRDDVLISWRSCHNGREAVFRMKLIQFIKTHL